MSANANQLSGKGSEIQLLSSTENYGIDKVATEFATRMSFFTAKIISK
jgi:hypothetical protein